MTGWNEAGGLKWRPLAPFGVEIDRDLGEPFAAADAERFVALFREYALIVVRGQALSMEQQTRLLALLGPVLLRTGENGYLTTEHEHPAARAGLTFHADQAYTLHPFEALSLHAVDVVDGASSTRFASAERGYAALPRELLAQLSRHEVEMVSPGHAAMEIRACDDPGIEVTARTTLPTVRVHPRSGRRYLAVSELHAARIPGLPQEQSRALLEEVYAHLYAPENTVEHVWHGGDLVVWDNVALQHARGSLAGAGRRVLQRVIVGIEATS